VTIAPEIPSTLCANEVAALLQCNVQTLLRMQKDDAPESAKRYPKAAFMVGHTFRWLADDVARFMSGTK